MAPAMITLRDSRPDDANVLLRIWCDSVDATHRFLAPADRAAIEPLVAEYVRAARLLVASRNGDPVGFLGVTGQNIDFAVSGP